MLIKMLNIY